MSHHYAAAEAILDRVSQAADDADSRTDSGELALSVQVALVHAVLAVAAELNQAEAA